MFCDSVVEDPQCLPYYTTGDVALSVLVSSCVKYLKKKVAQLTGDGQYDSVISDGKACIATSNFVEGRPRTCIAILISVVLKWYLYTIHNSSTVRVAECQTASTPNFLTFCCTIANKCNILK